MKAEIAMAESVLIIDPQFKGTMAPMVDGSRLARYFARQACSTLRE